MLTFAKYLVYPLVLGGSVYGLWAFLETDLPLGIALLIISAANIIMVACLELILPYDKEWKWWGHRQTINDIFHGLATSELGPRLASAALMSSVVAFMSVIAGVSGGGLWPHSCHFSVQLFLAIVIVDFMEWGKHWLYHNVSFLWPIHALHHDMDRLNVTKGMRLHFLEGAVRFVTVTSILTVLGASPEILVWYTALLTFNGSLNHANIDIRLPGFVHYMIQSTQVHRLHHSTDRDLGRSNLGSLTTIPDHLFGTFRDPAKHDHGEMGITDSPMPQNFFLQLLSPLIWVGLVWCKARNAQHRRKAAQEIAIATELG